MLRLLLATWVLAVLSQPESPRARAATSAGDALVLSTVDGHVLTLDAWTGELRGVFGSGGPLVRSFQAAGGEDGSQKASMQHIVPGLDGTIYAFGAGGEIPGAGADPVIQELPLTAPQVVEAPVTLCGENMCGIPDTDSSGQAEALESCGLLTGERTTTLFALDVDTGDLRWVRESKTGVTHGGERPLGPDEDDEARDEEPMLLQKDEYTVHWMDVSSGEEHWNVSVSFFSTVEMNTPRTRQRLWESLGPFQAQLQARERALVAAGGGSGGLEATERTLESRVRHIASESLPNIILKELDTQGTMHELLALDPEDGQTLWRRHLSERQYPSSVHGVWSGLWVPLEPPRLKAGSEVPAGGVAPAEVAGDEDRTDRDSGQEVDNPSEDNLSVVLPGRRLAGEVSVPLPPHWREGDSDDAAVAAAMMMGSPLQGAVDNRQVAVIGTRPSMTVHSVDNIVFVSSDLGARELATAPGHTVDGELDLSGLPSSMPPSEPEAPVRSPEGILLSWEYVALLVLCVLAMALVIALAAFKWGRKSQSSSTPSTSPVEPSPLPAPPMLGSPSLSAPPSPSLSPISGPRPSILPTPGLPEPLSAASGAGGDRLPRSRSLGELPATSGSAGSGEPVPRPQPQQQSRSRVPSNADELQPWNPALAKQGSSSPGRSPLLAAMSQALGKLSIPDAARGEAPVGSNSGATSGLTSSVAPARQPSPLLSPALGGVSSAYTINNRYRTEFEEKQQLGEGGFGTVYCVQNLLDGHQYAIKKVRLSSRHRSKLEKVLREVRILAQLDHPHVVRYYQAWIEQISEAEQTEMKARRAEARKLGMTTTELTPTFDEEDDEDYSVSLSRSIQSMTIGHPDTSLLSLETGGDRGDLALPPPAEDAPAGAGSSTGIVVGLQRPGEFPLLPGSPDGPGRRSSLSLGIEIAEELEPGVLSRSSSSSQTARRPLASPHPDWAASLDAFSLEDHSQAGTQPAGAGIGSRPEAQGTPMAGLMQLYEEDSDDGDDSDSVGSWSVKSEDDEEEEYEEDVGDGQPAVSGAPDTLGLDMPHLRSPQSSMASSATVGATGEGNTGALAMDGCDEDLWDKTTESMAAARENVSQMQVEMDRAAGSDELDLMALGRAGLAQDCDRGGASTGGSSGWDYSQPQRRRDQDGQEGPSAHLESVSSPRRQHRRKGQQKRHRRRRRGTADAPTYDLWLYIQMQFCANHTLRDYLDKPERRLQANIDVPQSLEIFLQVAKGLAYVHQMALIHRDLKPSNCFFMGDGTVKIGDFGLSRSVEQHQEQHVDEEEEDGMGEGSGLAAADDEGLDTSGRWASGEITSGIGTFMYASPEQTAGGDYDEKTDIYSLGIMLFEMCHPPFGTGMERAVVLRSIHDRCLPADWPVQQEQPEVCSLILRMLAESPSERPSAEAVVQCVQELQGKQQVLSERRQGTRVLRVEAQGEEVLNLTRTTIRAVCTSIRIEQFGWRSKEGTEADPGASIMEFVLADMNEAITEDLIGAVKALEGVRGARLLE